MGALPRLADLLTWKQEGPIATEPMLIEVKSRGDRLSDDQRTWITLNHQTLHLPFRIVKVHRTERLTFNSDSHTRSPSSPPPQ
ncbi:hypothetical protein G7043_03920 [Lentzea sp. NEAU-D13]|uniref:VRR-NUC domain-containing protein n=1 Tax=Lentzea alba TaxID=2714351 RepID=A0A7C9VU46_9PSEU|nr:hypothetical protein [Lentzea alba]